VAGELEGAVVVAFPLRGEGWVAVNSPADRIPSHGTNLLAQRYAYDFIKVDDRRQLHYHPTGWLRTFLLGVPTRECYAWGEPVHAPFDGVIVRAVDGFAERHRVHPVREAALAVWNGLTFSPARLPGILGNHVILRGGDAFAAFVHLAPGSLSVREGQAVEIGEVIGRVGHTGNSTTPHLHFQLMDAADPLVARPVPCGFTSYEVLRDGAWQIVRSGIPRGAECIRATNSPIDDEGSGSQDTGHFSLTIPD
jgi:murein DD-endopeptidase MepM/ murein hydrolase activator NlpD